MENAPYRRVGEMFAKLIWPIRHSMQAFFSSRTVNGTSISELIMKITQCLHTAILVSDLDRAVKFYSNILGLSIFGDRTAKFPGIWYQVGEYQIHLIVNPDFVADTYHQKWGRNPHIAFTVDNLEMVKTRLQTQGYPIQMSSSGRAALFVKDPDGNIIELSQS